MIITDEIKRRIRRLAKKHRLSLVVLFGSQATGRTHAKSDVDIAVLGKGKIDRLQIGVDLDKVFGRDDVEIVDLGTASPTLMYVMVEDGQTLYEKTHGTFFVWKLYAIRTWLETAWLRVMRDKKLIQWASQN